MIIVVMGVCGSGKTTVGRELARAMGADFIEGDDLHPASNRAKMSSGQPLTDADRWPWLDAIAAEARQLAGRDRDVVVSCSALRRTYRDRLRTAGPAVRFIHLTGTPELLADRMAQRTGHFMPPGLLASQLATLEVPAVDEGAAVLDIAAKPATLVQQALEYTAKWTKEEYVP
jgi:carbohydrate kinase (thermoresistant glucokinase family)